MPLKIWYHDNIYWRHSSKHDYIAIDYFWRLQSQKISWCWPTPRVCARPTPIWITETHFYQAKVYYLTRHSAAFPSSISRQNASPEFDRQVEWHSGPFCPTLTTDYWTLCHMMHEDFAFASHLHDVHSLVAVNVTALLMGDSSSGNSSSSTCSRCSSSQ